MNRGQARQAVFLDDDDRADFLELVADARARWGVRTHALCLMDNHVHLLVEDPDGALSRAMRHVFGIHSQRFNARHGADGPLFRGRYRSRLVQHETYLAEVVRYIHLNPVTDGLVDRARDWPWSSHRHYLRGPPPPWLVTDAVLARFADNPRALDRFVHARVPEGEALDLGWEAGLPVLGDDAFVDAWRTRARQAAGHASTLPRELRRWLADDPREIIAAAAAVYRIAPADVLASRRGVDNPARQVALLLAADKAPGGARAVGEVFGLSPGSVTAMAWRCRQRAEQEPEFAKGVAYALDYLRAARAPVARSRRR
jgi:REP element-mobilizing transposase RayT